MNAIQHQGDSHKFVCAAVAYPHPVFVFRFGGARIVSNSSKHTVATNSTHGTLTVLNLQTNDEGTYTCSASNRYGSVSTAALLSVQGVFIYIRILKVTLPIYGFTLYCNVMVYLFLDFTF